MIKDIEIKEQTDEGQEFEPIPADLYECQITKVQEAVQIKYGTTDEEEKVIEFEFTIAGNGEYRGRKLWKKVRPIINTGFEGGQPSGLYQIIACVLGKIPEGKKFVEMVNSLENLPVRVGIKQHISRKGRKYNKVTEFYPTRFGEKVGAEKENLPF